MTYAIPRTMQEALDAKIAQHVARFVDLVRNGRNYSDAWAIVTQNSMFGPVTRAALESRCVEAANRKLKEVMI